MALEQVVCTAMLITNTFPTMFAATVATLWCSCCSAFAAGEPRREGGGQRASLVAPAGGLLERPVLQQPYAGPSARHGSRTTGS